MLVVRPQSPVTPDVAKVVPLPIEIYEYIIDHLLYSPETLCACALVCHAFTQRAQKLLFTFICFTRQTNVFKPTMFTKPYVWPAVRFVQTLSHFPHLARHVKALVISVEDRADNAVHQILPQLDNLEELVLEGNTRRNSVDFRRKLGHDLRVGILERCSSERLVVIYLVYVKNVPLCLLSLAPRLESLALQSVSFAPELDHHGTVGGVLYLHKKIKERRPPSRLREVYVKSTTSEEWRTLYPWLEHVHLELTHIKSLELHIDFETLEKWSSKRVSRRYRTSYAGVQQR